MEVPHGPSMGTAMGQALGLGPLGAQAGWFLAAGLGSSSKGVGRPVFFIAQMEMVAPLPTFHIMTQHHPKKWETWFSTLFCIYLFTTWRVVSPWVQ